MGRHEFKIPLIHRDRRHEVERSRQRLQDIASSSISSDDDDADPSEITRTFLQNPETNHPLSERLEAATTPTVRQREITKERGHIYDLSGKRLAELPCDETMGIFILGRGHNAGIQLDDPYVHRVHASVRWDPHERAHVISHGGGENGTYVNRRRIRTPMRLLDGVRLRVGRTELIYRVE